MSTVQKINFEPVSDINVIHRRDFPLADPTLANPINAVALVDGEWVTLSSAAGSVGKIVRATDVTQVGEVATQMSFPVFAERGRYDVQAQAERKVPILLLGQYEFDTRIYSADASAATGIVAITSLLQPLKVATISATLAGVGVRNFTGLVGSSYNDTAPIVGYVTRLPGNNGGKLRFISGWAVRNGTT